MLSAPDFQGLLRDVGSDIFRDDIVKLPLILRVRFHTDKGIMRLENFPVVPESFAAVRVEAGVQADGAGHRFAGNGAADVIALFNAVLENSYRQVLDFFNGLYLSRNSLTVFSTAAFSSAFFSKIIFIF